MTERPDTTDAHDLASGLAGGAGPSAREPALRWAGVLGRLSRWLPWMVRVTGPAWFHGVWLLSPTLRQALLANARRLAGAGATRAAHRRLARGILRCHVGMISDLGLVRGQSQAARHRQLGRVFGQEHLSRAMAAGRGVIVVTGSFETLEISLAALTSLGLPTHVVDAMHTPRGLHDLRVAVRTAVDITTEPTDTGHAADGASGLIDRLRQEQVIVFPADDVPAWTNESGGHDGQVVSFCDGHLRLSHAPWRLAMRTGAPVVVMLSHRGHDGLVEIRLDEPWMPPPGTQEQQGPHQMILSLARQLERHVRQHPRQWMHLRPIWLEDQTALPS